ncbi:MAG TPA: helix-turn-helix domain-containing protein [Pirellulales bacterium]|nr:helix-turn-helix domain-containing protein [Pirellulales bacterium]
MKEISGQPHFSVQEFARRLHVRRETVYGWIKNRHPQTVSRLPAREHKVTIRTYAGSPYEIEAFYIPASCLEPFLALAEEHPDRMEVHGVRYLSLPAASQRTTASTSRLRFWASHPCPYLDGRRLRPYRRTERNFPRRGVRRYLYFAESDCAKLAAALSPPDDMSPLATAAKLAQLSPHVLRHYCKNSCPWLGGTAARSSLHIGRDKLNRNWPMLYVHRADAEAIRDARLAAHRPASRHIENGIRYLDANDTAKLFETTAQVIRGYLAKWEKRAGIQVPVRRWPRSAKHPVSTRHYAEPELLELKARRAALIAEKAIVLNGERHLSIEDTAEHFGVHEETVRRRVKRHGLRPHKKAGAALCCGEKSLFYREADLQELFARRNDRSSPAAAPAPPAAAAVTAPAAAPPATLAPVATAVVPSPRPKAGRGVAKKFRAFHKWRITQPTHLKAHELIDRFNLNHPEQACPTCPSLRVLLSRERRR